MENIIDFKLRGFYPNYNYYKFLIDHKGSFPVHKIGEGYRKSIVEYSTESGKIHELEIDFEDSIFLLNKNKKLSNKYLENLLKAKNKDKQIGEELQIQNDLDFNLLLGVFCIISGNYVLAKFYCFLPMLLQYLQEQYLQQ